jgi:capsular polysaccharide biosynthesis protein
LQRLDDQVTQDQADLRGLDGQAAQADVQNQARAARVARVAAARRRTEAASARVDAIWQEVGSTRALSEAAPPTEPDPPSPVMVLNAACLFGLVAGFGSALLAERRRMTIDRPSDIARHLKLDVVARLSEVPMAQLR